MEISFKLIQGNGLFFALLSNDSCLNRLKELDSNFKNLIIPNPYLSSPYFWSKSLIVTIVQNLVKVANIAPINEESFHKKLKFNDVNGRGHFILFEINKVDVSS